MVDNTYFSETTYQDQSKCIGLSTCGGGCESCPASKPSYSEESLDDKLKRTQWKLDTLAKGYGELAHKYKLAMLALKASNKFEDYYAYDPELGVEQLNSLVWGTIVHIPIDWLKELLESKDAV